MSNIQLLAKGAIDTYLTQNPEISFLNYNIKNIQIFHYNHIFKILIKLILIIK